MSRDTPRDRTGTTTTTTREYRAELSRATVLRLLREELSILEKAESIVIFVRAPGGATYQGEPVEIGDDSPLCVSWRTVKTEEEGR